MLSVAVHKDVGEYKPKLIGKLTTRTLISIVGALGISGATALYMYFVLGLNISDYIYIVYAVSIPFWLCGFYNPHGMPFEKFAVLWFEYNFGNTKLFYEPSMMRIGYVAKPTQRGKKGKVYGKAYRKFLQRKGIEAYDPSTGRVSGV